MKIKIKFFGKTVGALGINYQITETIEVENTEQETLFLALHKKGYEMMHWIELDEIEKETPEPDNEPENIPCVRCGGTDEDIHPDHVCFTCRPKPEKPGDPDYEEEFDEANTIPQEDLEAAAEFYDKHMDAQKIFQEGARILFWTKKLGDIHIEIVPRSPNETAGLCGAPLLGNDYFMGERYKNIDKSTGTDRKICVKCALALQKRLSEIHDKVEETNNE